ncbi:PLP-dependent transferase [Aspergillus heteromorphus CBS 117.55]|uniref:PLP-dependent transferase n=1 Tax=Aspergillus heteromorphus CBS 117.55 TaxID=1448321 RepID=A0A317VGY9_9EURO|nr:PLP-dependent transferase [Aspergillus heteromorphus CBS 117.55]PWY72288.1 PLP-dependent transferase [Aspergillus heteromorphus CBS 117.55]
MTTTTTTKNQPSLLASLQSALQKRETRLSRRRLTILPPTSTDFSSNDFLSLSTSPLFRARLLAHLQSAPPRYPFASGGSRLLDGNSPYAEALDAHEGMRLSRAGKTVPFLHSSPESLEAVLTAEIAADAGIRDGSRNVFVVVESVYSMDGDIAPLREFVEVVERVLPCGNGYFVVDEAHATGVFGPGGAGVVKELGLQERMFVRVHTFGKALASHGAIVLCCPDTRDYLINYARTVIYTTAMGFPSLAAIRTAYELLSEGETEEPQATLQSLIRYLRARLASLDTLTLTLTLDEDGNPTGNPTPLFAVDHFPRSPIFSLRSPVPRHLAAACQRKGFVVRAIMAPTVPVGKERVRVCLHAGNTVEEIDGLVETIRGWLVERQSPQTQTQSQSQSQGLGLGMGQAQGEKRVARL